MASGSVKAISSIEFEDFTGTISRYGCNGTISYNPSPFKVRISKDKKFLWISGGRITITSFSRTSSNPGVQMSLGLTRDTALTFGCGFRMDATSMRPEAVYGIVATNGVLRLQTTESYTNASGNPLHLIISSCLIPLE